MDSNPARETPVIDPARARSADIIERILGITDVALAHIDLNDLLRELLGRIREVLQTDEASILLLDRDNNSLSLRVSLGPDRLVQRPVSVQIGFGFAGRIAETKQPIVLGDISNYPFRNRAMLERGVRSLMGVPLLIEDRVLGVVHVGTLVPREFEAAELHLLELAAARIALAVERANLFEAERSARDSAERATRRNEFLANASEILSSSLDQRTILEGITQYAVPEVGDVCTINLIGRDEIVRLASSATIADLAHLIPSSHVHYARPLSECPSIAEMVQTGNPLLLNEPTDEFFQEIAVGSEHLRNMRAGQLKSVMRVPMKSGGRVIGVITVWLSNTDRRYGPEDLRLVEDLAHMVALATDNAWHYEEAQQAIGARDEFISIASHELKTPLTTIKGYVQLLRRQMNGSAPDSERLNRTLGQLHDQVGRFEELVDELLDVTRIQSGRIRLSYEHCDLSYLVSQVVERIGQAFDQDAPHNIRFPIPEPVWGYWDASRLDQVVTNLVSNAFKYSPAGSEVSVEVRACEAEAEIVVSDQGIGISQADLELILQPFTRGAGASDVAAGAGLGLYISNEIVQRHGGTLEIDSVPGEGSTFTIRLPRYPVDQDVKSDR